MTASFSTLRAPTANGNTADHLPMGDVVALVRAALSKAGFSRRQVTVRGNGAMFYVVTIRDAELSRARVAAVLAPFTGRSTRPTIRRESKAFESAARRLASLLPVEGGPVSRTKAFGAVVSLDERFNLYRVAYAFPGREELSYSGALTCARALLEDWLDRASA